MLCVSAFQSSVLSLSASETQPLPIMLAILKAEYYQITAKPYLEMVSLKSLYWHKIFILLFANSNPETQRVI